MNIKNKLQQLGFQLPEISQPGGNYSAINIRNNILYVSIQFPKWNGKFLYQGILGKDFGTEEGYKAMQICCLNVLAQISQFPEISGNLGLNHIEIAYCSTHSWDDAPKIADGASDLFIKVLGDKGKHTRSIFGVSQLPKTFCVGLTCSFTISE